MAAGLFGAAVTDVYGSPVPSAERILPADTLILLTTPDAKALRQAITNINWYKLLNDPALTPVREKLQVKFRDDFAKPIERDLGMNLSQLLGYAQGQVTLALLQDKGRTSTLQNWVLLLDSQAQAPALKSNLLSWQKQWIEAGKPVRTEKLRGSDFVVLTISTNDTPDALSELLPRKLPYSELGREVPAPTTSREVYLGMVDSAFVLAGSLGSTEAVVNALAGAEAPRLADQATFTGIPGSVFRDAPVRAWVNVKAIVDTLMREAAEQKPNPEAPTPIETMPIDQVLTALGLKGVKALAFGVRPTADGTMFEAFLSAPESGRTGLLKVLGGEVKETTPPPFVPADVVSFSRRRIDGQKAWTTVEKSVGEISPQALNILNFVLDTANAASQEKMPGFDVRKNLIGNLGDDLITYAKLPPGAEGVKTSTPARLVLISSPKAEELATSLRSVLVFITTQAGAPAEREFLGRKIYTVQVPSVAALANPAMPNPGPRKLHYAASGAYVAFSFNPALIEEHLRSSQTPPKSLREHPGISEAAQRVTSPGTTSLSYDNDQAQVRAAYEAYRAGGSTNSLTPDWLPLPPLVRPGALSKILDPSLLPPFEKIADYFRLTVSSLSVTQEGLGYKRFTPNTRPTTKP